MTKYIIGLVVAGLVLLTVPAANQVAKVIEANKKTTFTESRAVAEVIPPSQDTLKADKPILVTVEKVRTVTLEAKNTVVFRGAVTGESVGKAISQLRTMSKNLSKTDTIYLVLDTPGGSVFDGMDLIDFLEGLPQPIETVTLFAASMGFQIVESNPGKRLIVRNGTLMSHRAALGGLGGQLDGEFESRYKMIKRKVDFLDVKAADRLKMSLEEYKAKIVNELWVHGFDAKAEGVADEMILLQCGTTMDGTYNQRFYTIFGPVDVVWDNCPLIKDPLAIEFAGVRKDAQEYVKSLTHDLIYDKTKFVKDMIITNKFTTIFQ